MNYLYLKNKKKTILFLHGWGGSIESFKQVANWLYSYGYSVLLIDFYGFGKSEEPPCNFTVFDYANSVKELLNQLAITDFYVVAHSFGVRIAVILEKSFYIQKMVLTSGAGLRNKFSFKVFFNIKKYKFIKFLVKHKMLNNKVLDKYGSEDYKLLSDNMKKVFINVVNQNLIEYIKNVKSETLLYWGNNDSQTPLYMAKRFKKYIENSNLIIVNGSHFAYLENYFEFNNLVLNFFEKE